MPTLIISNVNLFIKNVSSMKQTYIIWVCIRIMVSNTYCVVSLLCFPSSCVPYVASFSGLSIVYCPFGIL